MTIHRPVHRQTLAPAPRTPPDPIDSSGDSTDVGTQKSAPAAQRDAPELTATDQAAEGARLFSPLLAGLVPSALGLSAYAILRAAYVWTFQRYGIAPEEIGIGHLQMFSSFLGFVYLWAWDLPLSPLTNILLFLLSVGLLAAVWGRLLPWGRRHSKRLDQFARRYPLALGASVAILLVILTFAWALPIDRSIAGSRLQAGQAVHPAELAVLSIQADPARVIWASDRPAPRELLDARLVYLGKADGILVLYQPPNWATCAVDDCRGAVWKLREDEVVLRIEVNPPDRDAPRDEPDNG
jgi:hypothetical protein